MYPALIHDKDGKRPCLHMRMVLWHWSPLLLCVTITSLCVQCAAIGRQNLFPPGSRGSNLSILWTARYRPLNHFSLMGLLGCEQISGRDRQINQRPGFRPNLIYFYRLEKSTIFKTDVLDCLFLKKSRKLTDYKCSQRFATSSSLN